MTTLTIDSTVHLPKTHFRDMEELTKVLLQLQFETNLANEYQEAKKLSQTDWGNI